MPYKMNKTSSVPAKSNLLLTIILSIITLKASAQNLVPNPGFEEETQDLCTVNPKEPTTKHWTFVTHLTPSIVTNLVDPSCRNYYATPFEGNHGVSLMISGEFQKPEFVQYIQAELLMPMEVGRQYYAEMWFRGDSINNLPHHYPQTYNNLGMIFSAKALKSEAYKLNISSQLDSIQYITVGGWTCLSGYITPKREYRYIVLGKAFNNTPSKKEEFLIRRKYNHEFCYFNIVDNVKVVDVTKEVNAIEALGNRFTNNRIIFKKNTTELVNNSETIDYLNRLYLYMKAKPGIKLRIIGHTDDEGTSEYNLSLSNQRAEKVYQYFTLKGISSERLSFEGRGKNEPLFANNSEENKQQNRRVEFVLH